MSNVELLEHISTALEEIPRHRVCQERHDECGADSVSAREVGASECSAPLRWPRLRGRRISDLTADASEVTDDPESLRWCVQLSDRAARLKIAIPPRSLAWIYKPDRISGSIES